MAIKHIETGQELNVNGDKFFPMASTFKVPVLMELLYQVQEGRYGLEDEIANPELSGLAIEIMLKCETGEKRIKGELRCKTEMGIFDRGASSTELTCEFHHGINKANSHCRPETWPKQSEPCAGISAQEERA